MGPYQFRLHGIWHLVESGVREDMVLVILRNSGATRTLKLNVQEDCQISSLKCLFEKMPGGASRVPEDCLTISEFVISLYAGIQDVISFCC